MNLKLKNSTFRQLIAAWAIVLYLTSPSRGQERDLVDLGRDADVAKLATTDAQAEVIQSGGVPVLRLATGHQKPWPGLTLQAPDGHWDVSPFAEITLQVKNTGSDRASLSCRVDNPGADGQKFCVTGAVTLEPGRSDTLHVSLRRTESGTLGGKLFGMRGYPVEPAGERGIDAAKVTQLVIFTNHPTTDHSFEITRIAAVGSYTPPTAWVTDADPFFPLIDTFGQYRHKDWPGKVHSLDELQQRRDEEARELTMRPGPENWDEYGGWAHGPQLNATGFFRTEKYQGKWWLVDPAGHLFFSHGIDCVRMLDTTPVEGRQEWFADFPGDRPEFSEFRSKSFALKGHYEGKSPQCFSFAAANMKRKYGGEWKQQYAEVAHHRLRSWGLNTIGNWSDAGVYLMRRTPYTDTLGSRGARMIEGSEGYWGKFPDVFDPGFARSVQRSMEEKRRTTANDPWCIGYFSDNEMSWGDDTSLALAALKSPPDQAAKKVLVADLQAKYTQIQQLNAAWGTSHSSWESLLESRETPDRTKAAADLTAFYSKTAETYFRTVRDAIRDVAPHQLYLGCRFAWVNDRADLAAGKYCDVISYNLYRRSVAEFRNPSNDKPLIIGEFHFGALDRGMFHTGLVPTANQEARANAYRDYVRGALNHPQFVGTHWFQWKDEPTTGRVYDEENYQIGFLDVADTPYRETIEASRSVGYHLYEKEKTGE